MITFVRKNERALLFNKGDYVKSLKPGYHFVNWLLRYSIVIYDINEQFIPGEDLNLFAGDADLVKELEIIDVKDDELVLHFEDDKFFQVLTAGKYAFWKLLKKHTFQVFNIRDPEIDASFNTSLLNDARLAGHTVRFYLEAYEKGLLFFDGIFQRLLEPGNYNFWKGAVTVNVQKVDMRQLQLDMTGQEIMTKDKVSLRLNFFCQYRVSDPVKAVLDIKSYEEQLYIVMQLVLREYVGSLTLDELLSKKEDVGTFVLEKMQQKCSPWGLEISFAGVKDIVLPGEIRTILNSVIEAEKKALANVITRREETASTRSLLNTARLMEDNPTLYKLKELEYIEKVSDKIHNLTVFGGGKLIEQLSEIFRARE